MTPVGWRTKTERRKGVRRSVGKMVFLPENVWQVIEAEGIAQQRTRSNMILVYLTTHAAVVPGVGQVLPGHRRAKQTPGLETIVEPEPAPRKRDGRQETCPHSIPATMKCLVCDE